jgi:dUTP pyrophosphatase
MEFNYLYIYTNNNELKDEYMKHIQKHNLKVNSTFPDAGFDLLSPNNYTINDSTFLLNTEIICCMKSSNNTNLSYYLYPRSSIIKTPLRLANSVGIIDSGYRGHIKACFDINHHNIEFIIDKFSRLVQVCSPDLKPLKVSIVDELDELNITERGEKGFGSSGK